MLSAALDLSRQKLDVHLMDEEGTAVEVTAVRPDADALRALASLVSRYGQAVTTVIESMNGARFIHDQLERWDWDVRVADAVKVKGLAPLAAKTDESCARVLAELARRISYPPIWLPDPSMREARERARFRLHLVRHRIALKNRIHATLMTFGHPVSVSDLFSPSGRELLERLMIPEPWSSTLATSLGLVDDLEREIRGCEAELRRLGADHEYVPRLMTVPGIGRVLGYTIAAELGDIGRFSSPTKLVGYTGLCPRVYQSGDQDRRGSIAMNGPKHLRWALVEAATTAARHPYFRGRYLGTERRLGRQRGPSIARIELARDLATAIWHMLSKDRPCAPAGPASHLAA